MRAMTDTIGYKANRMANALCNAVPLRNGKGHSNPRINIPLRRFKSWTTGTGATRTLKILYHQPPLYAPFK